MRRYVRSVFELCIDFIQKYLAVIDNISLYPLYVAALIFNNTNFNINENPRVMVLLFCLQPFYKSKLHRIERRSMIVNTAKFGFDLRYLSFFSLIFEC